MLIMKKIYLPIAFALLALASHAQTSAITACKKASGEVDIFYDVSKNCTLGPAGSAATLGSRTEIGFHSGANSWSAVREWDLPTSVSGVRISGTGTSSVFQVTIANPAAYYGLAVVPTTIYFVFNDGAQGDPTTGNFPWYAEGKDQGATNCLDFFVTIADLATCAASGTQDLRTEISVLAAPNPFSTSTILSFDNPNSENYSLKILNLTGQEVRNYQGIKTGSIEIRRDALTAGLYFAVLQDAQGRFLTEKLVIK